MRDARKVGCVDFDGVVTARYEKDLSNAVLCEDCAAALRTLSIEWKLVLLTARHDLDAVREFLHRHELLYLFEDVTNRKPAAEWYLDDRGVRFHDWPSALAFVPHAAT